ncbi:MAG: cytochrome c maturation protein CcmE [Gemmatimonadaceae bacterium]|nr:cytochrome c maturation protein CcmE [Gemmatimonadaceae bacterium]
MKRAWVLGGGAVILGVFAWLLFGGLEKNMVFFLTPRELLAKGTEGVGVPVRLGGQVKPGSVKWDAQALDLRFTVTDGGGEIPVRATGAPPQMFRDGMGVIVEGRVGTGGVFEASNLMVKHSNEYRAPKPGEEAHEKYKTLIQQSATP